jgi:hypothetical protein
MIVLIHWLERFNPFNDEKAATSPSQQYAAFDSALPPYISQMEKPCAGHSGSPIWKSSNPCVTNAVSRTSWW